MLSLWDGEGKGHGSQPPLALQQAWNHTPLAALGGLTPAQAMVGIGPQEAEPTWAYLADLESRYGDGEFAEEEEPLRVSVELLGDWLARLRGEDRPVTETIVAERSALLARRAQLLRGSGSGEQEVL